MKVYLAAPYALRDELRFFVKDLEKAGHECTSSRAQQWHDVLDRLATLTHHNK